MIEVMDAVNAPGAVINEDRIGHRTAGTPAAWVIDGATGVAEREHVLGGPGSDAAWLAQTACALLVRRDPGAMLVQDYFAAVIAEIRAAYAAAVPNLAALPAYALPSATITWMRPVPGAIEFAYQGDCTAVVVVGGVARVVGIRAPGSWEALIDERDRAKLARQSDDKARIAAVIDELRGARSRLNQPGGYWMLGIEPAAASGIAVERVPLAGEATVLLASDGLWRLVDAFRLYDASGLVQAARARGLAALLAELRQVETEDSAGTRAPRVKEHDDASGMLLRVLGR
ncbi:hypothetical protein [Chelatococcus reniformis]|uniref:PPM-type phosphatase domain-containing protein n=1 Tax=Chelatococcus reniformis TaxID=1494448 RepID=A0A916TX89_9HYPH|nr:hypothetical protein [Chelatococcus reniformis]GGC50322.1 hypothetical protein GCM10010994_06840 [Chelatococcus reniformis]